MLCTAEVCTPCLCFSLYRKMSHMYVGKIYLMLRFLVYANMNML